MAKQSSDAGRGRGPNVVKKSAKGRKGSFYAILGLVAAVLGVFIIYQVSKPPATPESTKGVGSRGLRATSVEWALTFPVTAFRVSSLRQIDLPNR